MTDQSNGNFGYTQNLPFVHSMARGNIQRSVDKLIKAGVHGKVLNLGKSSFQEIESKLLEPLDTQRETKDTWASSRIIDQGGFDMVACGALSVAYDKNDGRYYVFDGCGRLLQAQLTGLPLKLPCMVYDITKEEAAWYFGYTQDKGRRTLSKEVIYVNRNYSGELEAKELEQTLSSIGCYIQGGTEWPVPGIDVNGKREPVQGSVQIKYRALTDALRLSGNDLTIVKQARDMIVSAWSTTGPVSLIRQDLFLGLILLLKLYPAARLNGCNKALQRFLVHSAVTPQDSLKWKKDGGNIHNNEAASVVLGLLINFRNSTSIIKSHISKVPLKVIQDYIDDK